MDPAINDALRIVTGCLRPTPADNLPILAGIQPTELRRDGATLSLARRAMGLDICSTQRSPVHRVQMHIASNRDTHLYPPYNDSPVHLTTTTNLRHTGRITNGMRSGRTIPEDSSFSCPTPIPSEWPSKKESGSGWNTIVGLPDPGQMRSSKWNYGSESRRAWNSAVASCVGVASNRCDCGRPTLF